MSRNNQMIVSNLPVLSLHTFHPGRIQLKYEEQANPQRHSDHGRSLFPELLSAHTITSVPSGLPSPPAASSQSTNPNSKPLINTRTHRHRPLALPALPVPLQLGFLFLLLLLLLLLFPAPPLQLALALLGFFQLPRLPLCHRFLAIGLFLLERLSRPGGRVVFSLRVRVAVAVW